jgi:hypothetical protein
MSLPGVSEGDGLHVSGLGSQMGNEIELRFGLQAARSKAFCGNVDNVGAKEEGKHIVPIVYITERGFGWKKRKTIQVYPSGHPFITRPRWRLLC